MLIAVANAIEIAREHWPEGESPALVAVWVVPGSLGKVNFTGQRITLFSRKKKMLQIEVAVPEVIADAGGYVNFVIDSLRQASRTAAEHFKRKKVGDFDVAAAETIIEKARRLLVEQGW